MSKVISKSEAKRQVIADPVGHTPGPWRIAESTSSDRTKTSMRRVRSEHEGTDHGAVCEVYGISDGSIAAANARLIAAAPDLLAACQQLIDFQESTDLDDEPEDGEYGDGKQALIAARAAVAKATTL